MPAQNKVVTVDLHANVAKALTWVLQEALEISAERIPGLSVADATDEITDLSSLATLLSNIGGDPEAVTSIARKVTAIASEIEDRAAPKFG
jgi:hypothetical protein